MELSGSCIVGSGIAAVAEYATAKYMGRKAAAKRRPRIFDEFAKRGETEGPAANGGY
jgi:hypothetical protein